MLHALKYEHAANYHATLEPSENVTPKNRSRIYDFWETPARTGNSRSCASVVRATSKLAMLIVGPTPARR